MITPDSAREDLAFLRGIVQAGDNGQRQFGEGYLAGGLCYGLQMLGHGAQAFGWLQGDAWSWSIGFLPTVVFIALMFWITRKRPGSAPSSVPGKAIGATFAAIGAANVAMIVIIGAAAYRERSMEVWQLYPSIVMVLQGAAWMVAWALQRKLFPAVVAVGWFVVGISMGLSIGNLPVFMIVTGLGLLLFMVVPGAIMMRTAKPA